MHESLAINGASQVSSTLTIWILCRLPSELSRTVLKDKKSKLHALYIYYVPLTLLNSLTIIISFLLSCTLINEETISITFPSHLNRTRIQFQISLTLTLKQACYFKRPHRYKALLSYKEISSGPRLKRMPLSGLEFELSLRKGWGINTQVIGVEGTAWECSGNREKRDLNG